MPDVIDTILKHEGGYQNDPNDHVNIVNGKMIGTNYGITPQTLAKHRGLSPRQLTAKDMMALSEKEARDIYNAQYVHPFKGIKNKALRNNMIDMGVNAGPSRAIKILQESLGAKADGKIGPKTLKTLNSKGFTTDNYSDARIGFYKGLASQDPKKATFLNGWTNRANSFRKQ